METLVVGGGAMGRWAGRLLGEALDADLSVLDVDPEAAREAAADIDGHAVDPATLAERSEDRQFEVVCVAVPIPETPAAIRRYGPRASAAVVDVAGTMADPVAAMSALSGRERASLHPLFAPDREPGNVPVVVASSGPTVDRLLAALEARGNHVFETTPAAHDAAMETVQARTHAAILAFALAADAVPARFHTPVSADLVALADRVTGGDPGVYGDIQAAFDGADDVAAAARRIADADDAFDDLYREATRGIAEAVERDGDRQANGERDSGEHGDRKRDRSENGDR